MKANFISHLTEHNFILNSANRRQFFLGGLLIVAFLILSFQPINSNKEDILLPMFHNQEVDENLPSLQDEEFIYIIAFDKNNINSVYISAMIQYDGYNNCNKSSQESFTEAGQSFLDYLVIEYSADRRYFDLLYVGASGESIHPEWNFKGFDTKAKLQNVKDGYIRNITNSNNKIFNTRFTYKCHMEFSHNPRPNQNNTDGKSYWISYFVKNSTVYVTNVYNNNCNHCQDDISEAYVKWLILNNYDHHAATLYVINMHDVNSTALDQRRTDKIIWYKQNGYSVVSVGFTYTGK